MDPDLNYRTAPNIAPATAPVYSRDDIDNGTLKSVYNDLLAQKAELDKWSAFNVDKSSPFTVEQQIEINRRVYEIIQPVIDSIESALALTDDKFRNRS